MPVRRRSSNNWSISQGARAVCRLDCILLVFSIAATVGCGPVSTNDEMQRATSADEASEANDLDASLAAWQSGNKDAAAEHLLSAKGEDLAIGSALRVFQLSEDDVKSMSRAQRRLFQEEVIKIVRDLRGLGQHCLALGDKSLDEGEVDTARQYFEAVNRLGRTLNAPQRVLVLHDIGEFLIRDSDSGLKRCE
jgi:hypothetical protein